jgi:hypothetical protein
MKPFPLPDHTAVLSYPRDPFEKMIKSLCNYAYEFELMSGLSDFLETKTLAHIPLARVRPTHSFTIKFA